MAKDGTVEPPPLSARRRWAFRLAAAVGLPTLLLLLAEGLARLCGVGHPTSFFLPRMAHGRTVWSENAAFGLRFFPPELTRIPAPLVMPRPKPEGVFRIFIFGESAALGDPEPAFGFGRYLQALLEERFPGGKFEVIPAAMTAVNSHVLLPVAQECAGREGDLWVVYMGNNEFVGPFGAGSVFGPQTPPLPWIRANLALRRLRLAQWLGGVLPRRAGAQPTAWGGMKMFLESQVPPFDVRRPRVYQAFERNLADMLDAAKGAGTPVVLCSVASNLRDCAPFASTNPPPNGPAGESALRDRENEARRAAAAGRWTAAREGFEAAARLAPQRASLPFELGRCELALSNFPAALTAFSRARDLDSLPFRADSTINDRIRQAAETRRTLWVDTVELLRRAAPDGVPGNEFFHDHVHLNFAGNYLVAKAVADQVRSALPKDWVNREGAAGWASFETASQRLALTDWDRRRVCDNMGRRLSEPPFTGQSTQPAEMERLREELRDLRARRTAASITDARALYASGIQRKPEDFQLIGNFAKFLEDNGEWADAHAAWVKVRDLLPWEPAPYFYLGKVAMREKRPEEALGFLDQALSLRPDLADAWLEEARIWLEKKDYARARAAGETALRWQPNNGRIHLGLAEVELAAGNRDAYLNRLKTAIERQPALWEAHYSLGIEWVTRNRIESARDEFAAVVRLHPDYPLGHFNLGVALARLKQATAARAEFEAVVQLDPQNAKAREYLRSLAGE